MAIKKTINFKGLVVDGAYIRVVMPTISPGNARFEFVAHVMATAESQPLSTSAFEAPYDL